MGGEHRKKTLQKMVKPGDGRAAVIPNTIFKFYLFNDNLLQWPKGLGLAGLWAGLDPTTHSSDAEQFMSIQTNSAMAYILKANALILVRPPPVFTCMTTILLLIVDVIVACKCVKVLDRVA
ncbi:hypothetical protein Tco_1078864 [Tanacetum coccineum]|uniref:Uncharacterized protein n=1 Tax=Tanacetum coccineum TaxID=301880 RepID=A0ABQ5HR49_9ASTR